MTSSSTSFLSSNGSNCLNDESELKSDDQVINLNSVSNSAKRLAINISSNQFKSKSFLDADQNNSFLDMNDIKHMTMENTNKVKGNITKDTGWNENENNCSESDSDDEEQKEFEMIIYDPSVFKPLPTQIAGHGSEDDGEKGFLKRPDGRLLKPVQAPPRGRRELDFYKRINASKDPTDLRLKQCIPQFFGVEKVGFINGITITEEFLILRDITEGFARPSIMDIKIGSRTWGPDASAKKQAQEIAKYAGTKHPFGFSILGLIVHSLGPTEGEYLDGCLGKKYSKSFGKNLKTEDVHTVPEIFFGTTQPDSKIAVCVRIMAKQIRAIYEAFDSQRKYIIYGSSLLMSYDADAVNRFKLGDIDENELESFVNVKLIDFAHAFPAEGVKDENFLNGLSNLLTLFEDFYKKITTT